LQTTSYGAIIEAMTKSWSDERLEERFDRIDQRFDRVESDIRELRSEMKIGFGRIDDRFDALNRTLLQLGGVTIAALLGLIATQL
jgi:hypothetical protein